MIAFTNLSEVEANCAICNAPPVYGQECPHEGERLELALTQAMERWAGMQKIRDWVLHHARNQVISTFHTLRQMRMQAHQEYLQTLPYYTLYHKYNGQPPLQPAQLQMIHRQIQNANQIFQQGLDQDWRTSCLRYPEVLDYYFGLVDVVFPSPDDPAIQDPRFGAAKESVPRRVKERRDSIDMVMREYRPRQRRRSRGGNTPPPAPMPGTYRR